MEVINRNSYIFCTQKDCANINIDNETEESYIQEKIESYVGNLKIIVDTYKEIEDFKDCQIELWNEFIEEV